VNQEESEQDEVDVRNEGLERRKLIDNPQMKVMHAWLVIWRRHRWSSMGNNNGWGA